MTAYEIDCPECDYEATVFGEDVAQGRVWLHRRTHGHDAGYSEID